MPDGDFEAIVDDQDQNPKYTQAYKMLSKRKDKFLLTMDDDMVVSEESFDEKENEQFNTIHETMFRTQSKTNALF